MTRTIVIKASDVAAIIGRNPYKDREEIKNELLKKYWNIGETKNEKAQRTINETGFELKISPTLNPENDFQESKLKIDSDEKLSQIQKHEITEFVRTKIYTGHGIRTEDITSDRFANDENVILKKDETFYRISICEFDEFDFEIVGRVDRIQECEDGSKILVEIKNRTKRLFRKVPEYENVQVQVYLQMLNLQKARLVEQYSGQIMSHDICRDDNDWKKIMSSLEDFCHNVVPV